MLHGSMLELQLLARHLGVEVRCPVRAAYDEAEAALYPSSETYELYLRHVKGTCGCPNRRNQIS
jgi:hypothetical protein